MAVEGIRANNGLLETINIALLSFCGLASGLNKKIQTLKSEFLQRILLHPGSKIASELAAIKTSSQVLAPGAPTLTTTTKAFQIRGRSACTSFLRV